MRKHILLVAFTFFCCNAMAQTSTTSSSSSTTTSSIISGLSVPVSPAFSIVDITPTLVQNPTTPKSFVLGVAQSVSQGSNLFPNNYSAQFAPIWWVNPTGINFYSYTGVSRPIKGKPLDTVSQNIFSGLKFTTLSVGFVNKDMIADTSKATQNIYSLGMHTTLMRVYSHDHVAKLSIAANKWQASAHIDMNDPYNKAIRDTIFTRYMNTDSISKRRRDSLSKLYKFTRSDVYRAQIDTLLKQKPVFAWDISAAMAEYGVNGQTAVMGRAGVWTDVSFNLPVDKKSTDYFNINVLGRYLYDRYQQNNAGVIGAANNIDIGGNVGFSFNDLSFSAESLYRFVNGAPNTSSENRTVGIISVKVTNNIFINGTFGKDFAGPNKLISLFGINWGLGNEKVGLP